MDAEKEVKRLAELARISVPAKASGKTGRSPDASQSDAFRDKDVSRFAKEFEQILAYVGKLNELSVDVKNAKEKPVSPVNVFREDVAPHETGKYTEAITAQFPKREGDALSVKQILSYD